MAEPAVNLATDRESRAREWIRLLTELPERFAGGSGERQAAERVGAWMRDLGIGSVTVEPAPGAPRAGLGLALHTGVAALGCWWGGMAGALLAVLGALSFVREVRHRRPSLSRFFRPTDSANVIGRYGADSPAQRVVLSAHIDTTQAGWIFSRDLANLFARTSLTMRRRNGHPPGPHAVPEALLIGAAVLMVALWFGAHGALLGLLRLFLGFALLVACVLGLQWAASPATPGANDNASAVAAMLICAERLMAALPGNVQLWLIGTGAEEVGSGGMHAFVDRHRDWPPEHTYYVNFECVGGGTLHYIASEGILGKVSYPPALLELARRLAAGDGFGAVTSTHLLAGTDGHVPAERGYPSLSLISLEASGVPRNYHRRDDTVDGIDLAMVVRAADFGAAVAFAALRGDAGPIRPVLA